MLAALVLSLGAMAVPAMAENPCAANPCAMKKSMNPCAANPCAMKEHMNPCAANPCAMKEHMNPCAANPCAMKKNMNPCASNPCSANPCAANPCSADANIPIRPHAFDSFQQAVDLGKKLWNDDENLGSAGVACMSCHADYESLHLERNKNFPHFVGMVGDVVSLDQMINYCLLNPMKGKQFDRNSKEMTAMAAYYRAYRMQYRREHR
jgi:cytochrome c